jgi:hypothetical protein
MDTILAIVLVGAGATAATDLWAFVRRRLFGIATPDFGLVGRWFAHMPRGRFRHASIANAAPVRGERALGWTAHYLIGIGFAALVPALWGVGWLHRPTLGPALLVGLVTVLAPFLVMQPGMGTGLAARRMPRPWRARFQSLLTHVVFGLGLYVTASGIAPLSVG